MSFVWETSNQKDSVIINAKFTATIQNPNPKKISKKLLHTNARSEYPYTIKLNIVN